MLVVTPSPKLSESLFGYLLRIAEANGYSSVAPVLSIAGYKDTSIRSSKFDWKQLSRVLGGVDLSEFDYGAITNRLIGGGLDVKSKNMLSVPELWCFQSPHICPDCINEKGHIEAHWDLAHMVACPRHGIFAISQCHGCGAKLGWNRQGLLKCKCGADLNDVPRRNASLELLKIVEFIEGLFYQKQKKIFPVLLGESLFDWNGVSLYQLVTCIRLLSKRYPVSTLSKSDKSIPLEIFKNVFSDWPKSYHSYIETIGVYSEKNYGTGKTLVKKYSSLYGAIRSKKIGAELSGLLVSEFVKYGYEVDRDVFTDDRLKKRILGTVDARFLTPAQAARETGMSPVTLRKWAEKGYLKSTSYTAGELTRKVIDIESANIKTQHAGKVFQKRQAAAELLIPVTVLEYIEKHGLYRHRHKSSKKDGYHSLDIQDVKDLIVKRASVSQRSVNAISKAISLDKILANKRFITDDTKGQFFAEFLEGTIDPSHIEETTIRGIYFDSDFVDDYIEVRIKSLHSVDLNKREAAKIIGFPIDIIRPLYENGFLLGKSILHRGLWLDEDSVYCFLDSYVSLLALSKELGVGIRRLKNFCNDRFSDIPLLSVARKDGPPCYFLDIEQANRVRGYVISIQKLEEKKRIKKLSEPTKHERLLAYFDELVQKEQQLPRLAGRLNLKAIADEIPGLSRNDFYAEEPLKQALDNFDKDDRERHGLKKRDDIGAIEEYLAKLVEANLNLPIGKKGKPNKLEIAKACGVDRSILYKNKKAAKLIEDAQSACQ